MSSTYSNLNLRQLRPDHCQKAGAVFKSKDVPEGSVEVLPLIQEVNWVASLGVRALSLLTVTMA